MKASVPSVTCLLRSHARIARPVRLTLSLRKLLETRRGHSATLISVQAPFMLHYCATHGCLFVRLHGVLDRRSSPSRIKSRSFASVAIVNCDPCVVNEHNKGAHALRQPVSNVLTLALSLAILLGSTPSASANNVGRDVLLQRTALYGKLLQDI